LDFLAEFFGTFLVFFWEFFENLFRGFFWRNVYGGIFWEDFWGRNFLGGIFLGGIFFGRNFLGGIFWEEFFVFGLIKLTWKKPESFRNPKILQD
jgi:hypothetical protein